MADQHLDNLQQVGRASARAENSGQPLTPATLQAIIQQERLLVYQIAALGIWTDSLPELQSHGESVQEKLDQLTPETRPYAQRLWDQSLRGKPSLLDEDAIAKVLADASIYHWLEAATRGLCPEAQEIVLPELLTHYQELLDDTDAGIQPEERSQQALQRLGPAKDTARALAKVHLTQNDVRKLVAKRTDWGAFTWSVMPATFIVYLMFDQSWLIILCWAASMFCMAIQVWCYFRAKRASQDLIAARWTMNLQFFSMTSQLLFWCAFLANRLISQEEDWVSFAFFALMMVIGVLMVIVHLMQLRSYVRKSARLLRIRDRNKVS